MTSTKLVTAVATNTVAVTSGTILFTLDTTHTDQITVQIENLSGAETFTGTVQRRLSTGHNWANSSMTDFNAMAPAANVVADIDVSGSTQVRISGTMTGAGGNAKVTVTRRQSP